LKSAQKKEVLAQMGRERVVFAGLKILNETGLDGLTLSGIAAEIGVQAPTLYWRFKNKQDLIDEMATQVLSDWVADLLNQYESQTSWDEWIFSYGVTLRTALLRFRDGARMVAGSYFTDTAIYEAMEKILESFKAAGFRTKDATMCLNTAYSFVIGFTIEEQATFLAKGTRDPRYARSAREARVDIKSYPLTRSAGPELFENYDARFETSLRLIITGFAAEREKPVLQRRKRS
jgi:TetR/AcrR family transcriptional regulator, tetracycline repressor protein